MSLKQIPVEAMTAVVGGTYQWKDPYLRDYINKTLNAEQIWLPANMRKLRS